MFPDLSHLNLFKLLLYAAPHPLPTRIGGGGASGRNIKTQKSAIKQNKKHDFSEVIQTKIPAGF